MQKWARFIVSWAERFLSKRPKHPECGRFLSFGCLRAKMFTGIFAPMTPTRGLCPWTRWGFAPKPFMGWHYALATSSAAQLFISCRCLCSALRRFRPWGLASFNMTERLTTHIVLSFTTWLCIVTRRSMKQVQQQQTSTKLTNHEICTTTINNNNML